MADLQEYLALIPSANRDRPKFIAAVTASIQPLVDAQNLALSLQTLFDLDIAVGDQLDKTGEWIGVTRFIAEPLEVLYFSLDVPGAGLDQAEWQTAFEPTQSQFVRLDDEHYRILLKARVAANIWDGTVPGAYRAWQTLFGPDGFQVLIQDVVPKRIPWFALDDALAGLDQGAWYTGLPEVTADNMHIILAIVGPPMDALTRALFAGGYLDLKPAGVMIDAYATQSVPGIPMFALDVGPGTGGSYTCPPVNLGGLDIGAWADMSITGS